MTKTLQSVSKQEHHNCSKAAWQKQQSASSTRLRQHASSIRIAGFDYEHDYDHHLNQGQHHAHIDVQCTIVERYTNAAHAATAFVILWHSLDCSERLSPRWRGVGRYAADHVAGGPRAASITIFRYSEQDNNIL